MKRISRLWLVPIAAALAGSPVTGDQTAPAADELLAIGYRLSGIPTFDEAMAARRDVWGEAALAQPNGASYEFFKDILPPPRYVNADFHYYPVILSAPNAKVKARLISNGSGVNLRGGARSWKDNGTPVTFRVGPDEFAFGSLRERLSEPTLAEGWLPIVEIRYRHPTPRLQGGKVPLGAETPKIPGEIYRLEAFAAKIGRASCRERVSY